VIITPGCFQILKEHRGHLRIIPVSIGLDTFNRLIRDKEITMNKRILTIIAAAGLATSGLVTSAIALDVGTKGVQISQAATPKIGAGGAEATQNGKAVTDKPETGEPGTVGRTPTPQPMTGGAEATQNNKSVTDKAGTATGAPGTVGRTPAPQPQVGGAESTQNGKKILPN
jgi:hypothetical protein